MRVYIYKIMYTHGYTRALQDDEFFCIALGKAEARNSM